MLFHFSSRPWGYMAALSVVAVWAMLAPAFLMGPTTARQAEFSHGAADGRIQFLYYGNPGTR